MISVEKDVNKCCAIWCTGGINAKDPWNRKDNQHHIVMLFFKNYFGQMLTIKYVKGILQCYIIHVIHFILLPNVSFIFYIYFTYYILHICANQPDLAPQQSDLTSGELLHVFSIRQYRFILRCR